MAKTKTFDLNTVRLTGEPHRYYDNGWSLKIGLNTLGGTIWVSVPKKNNEVPITQEAFMAAKKVTILEGKFKHWVNKSNQTVYEIQAYPNKIVLHNSNTFDLNQAFVGGMVDAVSDVQRKFIVSAAYVSKRPNKGERAKIGERKIRVYLPEGTLPVQGQEVLVTGTAIGGSTGAVELMADQVERI